MRYECAPSLARTSLVAIINAWHSHSQVLRTLGHGQTLSRTHSCSKQPVLNTTRPLPFIVFVSHDCSGGARALHEGSRFSLTSSRPRIIWIWVSLTNAATSSITTPRCTMLGPSLVIVITSHQNSITKLQLSLIFVWFLTFQEEISHSLKLDIQRTSSVMIMTDCNWIKIQGLSCSNCEATSNNKTTSAYSNYGCLFYSQQLIMLITAFTMRFIIKHE